jgi:CubicO group peptidase (beta-lactamase class C family)
MQPACLKRLAVILCLGTLCGSLRAQLASPVSISAPAGLDSYIANAMNTFDVPGMAVAIVKDGKIVLAKGYGVRQLGHPAPVDAQTMFAIGSNTKAFTTAALAGLVDAGKLS